ncbi:hypothetical protein [Streptomyces sp. NPDC058751]|uniref:hypothetical protein n=1 Tax=Streptomyces sp. NPDC058751 TaxID=3346623 RepID=UPI0036CE519C
MSGKTTRAARLGTATAVALSGVLLFGTAPAHADGPTSRTVELSTGTTGTAVEDCADIEVWASPDPHGNYEACHYVSSGTAVELGDIDDATRQTAESKIRAAAGETTVRNLTAFCPYWMTTGPNRTPRVSYRFKNYSVRVVDHYADGSTTVVRSGSGTYQEYTTVTWTPGCWTR